MNTNDSTQKKCFIITPIGETASDIRSKVDGIIKAVIKPVLKDLGIKPIVPHELNHPGQINDDIMKNILNCHLCIANLTGLNPNVMYELAVRHATNKPVVCIAENGTILPFDLAAERTIFYSNEIFHIEEFKLSLRNFIENAFNMTQTNPITHANRDFKISPTETSINKIILDKVEILNSYIQQIGSGKYSITTKNTYRKIRSDNSTTYYICTEHEAFLYNLKERGYIKIVSDNKCLNKSF